MGSFCPFTGSFLETFREGVSIILKFSTAVFIYSFQPKVENVLSVGSKVNVTFFPFSRDVVSALFFRRPSSESRGVTPWTAGVLHF